MPDDVNETARRAFGDDAPAASSPAADALAARPRPALSARELPVQQLADWWTRAGAFVLDQVIVGAVVAAVAFAAAAFVHDPGEEAGSILLYAIAIPIGVLYAPLLMARSAGRNGQTFGKQIVGIRVVRIDGEPLTFWTGVLRTAIAQQLLIAVTFYVYAVVDYLWPLRDPRNQALHDKIARTWVVRAAAPSATPSAPVPPDEQLPRGDWLPPQAPGR